MTEAEKSHIWRKLIQRIDMTPRNSQAPGPQFDRSGLVRGVFRISCTDQASLTWLREAVNRIELIEGQTYQVVEVSQLYRLHRVKVWIPGEIYEPGAILSRLAKQNQGLDTSGWKLIHRQEKDNGQLLVLGVSDESVEVLKVTAGRVHLELSQVTFELPGQGQMGSH